MSRPATLDGSENEPRSLKLTEEKRDLLQEQRLYLAIMPVALFSF